MAGRATLFYVAPPPNGADGERLKPLAIDMRYLNWDEM